MYQTCEHSGSNWNLEKLLFSGKGKTGAHGEKPLEAEKRTNNKLDPHDNAESGNRTLGHIGGRGECSHHYNIPAPPGSNPPGIRPIARTSVSWSIVFGLSNVTLDVKFGEIFSIL